MIFLQERILGGLNEFSEEMKKSFLQLLLDYFTDIEHYEKCGLL